MRPQEVYGRILSNIYVKAFQSIGSSLRVIRLRLAFEKVDLGRTFLNSVTEIFFRSKLLIGLF